MKGNLLFLLVFPALIGFFLSDTYAETKFGQSSTEDQETPISFQTVKPIFQQRCFRCHSDARWNWTNYETAFRKRLLIKDRVWIKQDMPIGGIITDDERGTIKDWVDGGGQR